MASSIRDRLQEALAAAISARDKTQVSVLRTTLAALSNAEAVDPTAAPASGGASATEVERRHLTELDVRAIVTRERDELRATAREMTALGHAGRAAELHQQADILDELMAGPG